MSQSTEAGKARVLVVEDEADVLHLVSWRLRKLGYEVVEAQSAIDALYILSRDESFDLLFTDVVLSDDLSGLDLVRRVRRAFGSEMKVLLTSGYLKHDLYTQYGAPEEDLPLLPKPYTHEALASVVREALG